MKSRNLIAAAAMSLASSAALAAAPDTEAVEYYNVFTNHYFITATGSESGSVDRGDAGPGWLRTGRSFQAWLRKADAPTEALPVCRFYSRGANSHFYTADNGECEGLKRGNSGWTFEGIAFYIQAPVDGKCPADTVELLRVYNDGFRSGEGANHRFVDDSALGEALSDDGWIPEGTVFCAAPKATGTNANLTPTTTGFDALAGTWKGEAKWKVERAAGEQKTRAPLELTLAADGTISGNGNGCTFAGKVNVGDGFRSLFMATVTASGCTDTAFNGEYRRIKFQRFGGNGLMVKMKRGDGPVEAAIDAWLTLDGAASTPPSVTPPNASFEGQWSGTLRWEAENGSSEVEANKALTLDISATGAISGSGFGCTATGTLGGTVTLAGCEQAIFNGAYTSRVKREGSGRLELRLKRDEGNTEAEIEGLLVKAGGSTPGTPSVPLDAPVMGAWAGEVFWMVGTASGSGPISFTVGADGTFSGAALGCTFAGMLQLALDGRSVVSGNVTAAGCTSEPISGSFRDVSFEREDGDALEVELEREVNGVRVKLKARVRRTG
jgi:hypothetical protein